MKITLIMSGSVVAGQLAGMFNEKYDTKIQVSYKTKEGTPLVNIDFGDTPPAKMVVFNYERGNVQQLLKGTG